MREDFRNDLKCTNGPTHEENLFHLMQFNAIHECNLMHFLHFCAIKIHYFAFVNRQVFFVGRSIRKEQICLFILIHSIPYSTAERSEGSFSSAIYDQ